MRISLELVPRTKASLLADAAAVRERFPRIDTFNLPHQPRFELTSLEAVAALRGLATHRIPHLRSHDFDPEDVPALLDRLRAGHIDEVIVIAGDAPAPDASARSSWPSRPGLTPADLVRALRARTSELRIYAAIDPHRLHGAALERNVREKLDAGVTGFFSQPLYDLHTLDACGHITREAPVFWGVSPVTSPRSQRYWETVNHVRFPAGFEPTLAWSQRFAARFMHEVAVRGSNLYLMPIKVDLTTYLSGLSLAA